MVVGCAAAAAAWGQQREITLEMVDVPSQVFVEADELRVLLRPRPDSSHVAADAGDGGLELVVDDGQSHAELHELKLSVRVGA